MTEQDFPDDLDAENWVARQEELQKLNFASNYAFGMPIPEALIAAGFATRSVAVGMTLLRDPIVEKAIDEAREWIKSKLVDNTNTILSQLDRDRDFAHHLKNPSAAVSATMAKAKILGLLDHDANAKVPRRITIEWGGDGDAPEDTQ